MPPDRMSAMPPDPLAVYTALWGISTQLEHIKGPLGAPRGPWLVGLLLLCMATAFSPQRRTLAALAFSMRCVWWLNRWPFMWASETIGGLTDLAIVWHLMLADVDRSSASQLTAGLGFSIRRQVAWFYGFAGFWKLNTSFLDHRYSCASVFFAQILDCYVPPHLLTPRFVELAIRMAPALTVAIELAVGACMLLGEYSSSLRGTCRPLGIVLALLLHLGIDITPVPHNIANFSHKIGLRYLWFAPYGTSAAAAEVLRHPLSVGAAYAAIGAAALAGTVAMQQPALWAQWTARPLVSVRTLDVYRIDWHVPAHFALTTLLLRGLWLGEGAGTDGAAAVDARGPRARVSLGWCTWMLIHLNTLLCVLWAAGTVVLGVTDNATPNMYSNLRQQGGGNHLLPVPMSLLQAWRYRGPGVGSDAFGGGLVRIEHHNSTHMAAYCPAETSAQVSETAVGLLRQTGHSGRVFNPAFAMNIGPHALPPRAAGPFVRYTLPAYELRRQLRDARLRAEPFEVTYTNLPGAAGDEQWRVHARGRTIKLVVSAVRDRIGDACFVLPEGPSGHGGTEPCQMDDSALLVGSTGSAGAETTYSPWERLLSGLQSWNPQPILWDDQTEIHCYG